MFIMIEISFATLCLLLFIASKAMKGRISTAFSSSQEIEGTQQQAEYTSDYAAIILSETEEVNEHVAAIHTEEIELRTYQATLDYQLQAEHIRLNTTVEIVQYSLFAVIALAYITTRLHWLHTRKQRETTS